MSQNPQESEEGSKGKKKASKPKGAVQERVPASLEEQILRRYAARAAEPSPEDQPSPKEEELEVDPPEEEAPVDVESPEFEPEEGILHEIEPKDEEPVEGAPEEIEPPEQELEEPDEGPGEDEPIEEQAPEEVEYSEDEAAPLLGGEETAIDYEPEEYEDMGEAAPEEEPLEGSVELPDYLEPEPPPLGIPSSSEEVVDTLRRLREDVGQISELSAEEGNIVEAYALAFLKIMQPLTKTITVDPSILPREMGLVERANVIPQSELVILFDDGRMESFDLTALENRDLLVAVIGNAMPRFNDLIAQQRSKIEKRIAFLSDVTRELQTIADSLAVVG
ncbi:MAG: hypothetical protein OEZ44_06420 [Candidatus Bathyarchaeota archaeon]|nr:hypothetical protein [Candidatus Bathyarchaeota archaeon]